MSAGPPADRERPWTPHERFCLMTNAIDLVETYEKNFKSRWSMPVLRRIYPELAARIERKTQEYYVAVIAGPDVKVVEYAGALLEEWRAATYHMEDLEDTA